MEGAPANKKISVIFVTNRKGYEEILTDNLDRQTFRDFEVIVADENVEPYMASHYYFKPRQKAEGDVWNINKAYNDAIDRAEGELLVFLQDFIWIPANGLQRFWDLHLIYPDALITGVGHKAVKGLDGISEPDERVFALREVSPGNASHWELNWSACPREAMPRFHEGMDKYYGGENQYIAKKAGRQIWIDRLNQCIGYNQDECGGRPADWEEMHINKKARWKEFVE